METFSVNGYKQDNNNGWFKYLLLIIMLGLAACFFLSGCNSTKLAKSLHEVKTDSVSKTSIDSTHVRNLQNEDKKSNDSVNVGSSVSGSDLQIDFGDTTFGGYLPVTIIQTDTTLIINPGGRIIKHITDRKTATKHDSTAVQKKDSSSLVNHDSVSVKKTLSVDLKKDTVDKTKDKKSSRVPIMAFVMLAVFLILVLVIIHYWSKIEAFFKL